MAKSAIKKKAQFTPTPKKRSKWHSERHLSFGTANYIVFALGILSIVIGFIMLAAGSMTIAPLLLVVGYSFLIPISILIGIGKSSDTKERIREAGSKIE